MLPLRVLAVDDEELALRRIELALAQMPDATLVGRAFSGAEGVEMITALRPDVVLLDVEMANQGGFDMLANLREAEAPLVIFVTAFENYAARAFRVHAVDYVLKPVDFRRLAEALDRARRTLSLTAAERQAAELRNVVTALQREREPQDSQYTREFWADRRGELVRVYIHQLEWLESEGDYVRLHADTGAYLIRGPLSDLEAGLDPRAFVRVRRSALVRVDRVRAIRQKQYGDCRIVLASGQEVRVGKTYLPVVRELGARR
jgi:DNA-binding LytR/AlgR family response regulator